MPAAVDSTLLGTTIFSLINRNGGEVEINQSASMERAFVKYVENNAKKRLNGYRIRIFFDNKQSARVESEETLKRFESMCRDVRAYRTYANPYFKVTVGDFRTKSEAMELLSRIKYSFPSAFVVKENISYPVVDKENAYVVDTIKVLRPIQTGL